MPKISSIATVPVPKLSDKLVGTSVGGAPSNQTNNFTLQQLKNLFDGSTPLAATLQSVLNAGNTATQSIFLTGTIEATNLDISNDSNLTNIYLSDRFYDRNNSQGTSGQYLTSTGTGVQWSTLTIGIPTLQQVLTSGNVSDRNITTTGNLQANNITGTNLIANSNLRILGTLADSSNLVGTSGQVLSSTVSGTSWVSLPSYSAVSPLLYNSVLNQFSIQQATSSQNGYLSSSDWLTFDGKQNAGNYITQLTGEASASGPGSATITLNNLAVINKTLTGLTVSGGTINSSDSILSAFGKLQNQINGVVTGLDYQGTWNASLNIPNLVSGIGTNGDYYVVDVAGGTNLDGITDWNVGDWAIFNGSTWQKLDNSESVSSVNGLTGAVVLTTTNIAEGTNLYFTQGRVSANADVSANTFARHNAVTLGTANGLSLSTQQLSLGLASSSTTGALSSTDWNTFNSKQNAITNPITGTLDTGQVAFGTAANTVGGSNSLVYNSLTNRIIVNQATFTGSRIFGNIDETNIDLHSTRGSSLNFTSNSVLVNTNLISFRVANAERFRVINTGNVLIGTTTDSGFRLDVNGTARVQGTATITGSTTAASAIARGANLTSTLVAAANNDVLVGLDVNPTFTNGAFTGVTNFGLRVASRALIRGASLTDYGLTVANQTNNLMFLGAGALNGGMPTISSATGRLMIYPTEGTLSRYVEFSNGLVRFNQMVLEGESGQNNINLSVAGNGALRFTTTVANDIDFFTNNTNRTKIFGSSGNLLLQNGGTFTDAGFRLDVNGTARVQGNLTTNLTAGSVPFIGASGLLGQDNTNLFWDNTNKRLGIGTNMPDSTLHVRKTLGGNNVFTMTSNSLNANAIQFRNDDNTLQGSFLATGTPFGYGTYLSNQVNLTGGSGGIGLRVSNTSNINFYGGNVDPDFGVNYFRLFGSTGNVLIQNGGTFTDAGFRLDVNGTARVQGVLTTTADAVVNGVNVGRGGGSISNNTRVSNNGLNANTTGNNNIAIGVSALALNTEGNANVAIGTQALSLNLIGASNTAIGFFAAVNTTSNDVTAIGSNALRNNTTGTQNVALGKSALTANITGSGNTALGTSALPSNTTGGNNVAIGLFALNGASTSSDNIAIGRDTIRFLTSGNNNLAIGTNSGRRIADGTNLTIANNSLFIGFDTRPAADNQTNQIVIGHTAIGLGSNTTVLGNTSTTHGRWYGSLLLGTTTNAASSILTMESTTQGFLPPRMTSAQRTAIASPAEGLLVIQTDGVQGLYIYINATWRAVAMI